MTNQINSYDLNFNKSNSYITLRNNTIEVFLINNDMNSLNYLRAINDLIKTSTYTIYCIKENGDLIKMGNDKRNLSLEIRLDDNNDYKVKLKDDYFILSKYFIFFNKINKVNLLKLSDKVVNTYK